MGSASKITSGVLWSLIVNLVNSVYGFISVPILIHYFGKTEYGIIGLAMSVNVYMQLMDMGFNSTNIRFFSVWLVKKNFQKASKLFQTSLAFYGIIGIFNGVILLGISLFSKEIFHLNADQDEILKTLFYVLIISAIISWYSSCFDQLIKATENVAWIQKRTLLPKVLQVIVLFITIYAKLNLFWYFALTTFSMFAILPLSVNKILKEIPTISFIPKFDKETFKEILPYCLNIFSFSIFQFSFYNLRPVFLGMQGSLDSVADYRVLNGIIGIVSMFGGIFMGVLLPSTSKIVAQGNAEAYYKVAYDGTKYISIVLCFCTFGMMTVGSEVITMYVGESFLYLIPWFNIWLLCTLGVHNQAISSLILSGSDIRAITYNTSISSIIGLIVAWFLIPYFEIGGVVIAFAIYIIVQLSFYYLYYWPKKMNIQSGRVFLYSFFPFVMIGVGATVLIDLLINLDGKIVSSFFLKGILFTIIYSIVCFRFLNKEDKKMLYSILKLKK